MKAFLYRLAKAYTDHHSDELIDYCFVFPNKRSGTFFRHYLDLCHDPAKGPVFEPEITTISDFIAGFSKYVEGSRYDLLFTLFNEYRNIFNRLSPDSDTMPDDFDKFVFWGDMLISDFNDVDRYMASPEALFKNVKDVREISADFLTDEQKAIISRYWGIDLPSANPESFWQHLTKDGEPRVTRDSFVKLWEILAPLYHATRDSLAAKGLCFSGYQYREVATLMKGMSPDEFPYKRVIFAGFNVLSTSELYIFERLRDIGVADFYWDFNFPDELKDISSAGHFLKRYIKEFPSRYDIDLPHPEAPDIDIISIPSNIGQVKLIGKLLEEKSHTKSFASVDTAIVLPSEDLFIDMLHSIPPTIGPVNITMGYPLRLTSIASLMRNIMSMHIRAKKVRDEWCYFYEDINNVLTHHLIKAMLPEECAEIRKRIDDNRMFTVNAAMLREDYPTLAPLFFPLDDLKSGMHVFDYTLQLIDFINERIKSIGQEHDNGIPLHNSTDMTVELGFLTRYRQSVEQLRKACRNYGITMRDSTFFHLIERTVNGETVNFIGEPLSGLQIMGVLETRALDFRHVLMPSMNERIFPRKHYTRSFIPNALRYSFGLSTPEFQEAMYAYYFYRLIARASSVTLLYDARTSGLKGGEMSRYLYQLIYLYPKDKLKVTTAYYDVPAIMPGQMYEIPKTPEVMKRLNRFLSTGDDRRYLSATAINMYLSCPMRFYFHSVQNIRTDDDITDYMDESVFGRIIHQVSELAYKYVRGNAPEVYIDSNVLDRLKRERSRIEALITSSINELYLKLPSESQKGQPYQNTTPLQGEARILGNIIADFIMTLFSHEARQPFTFIEGEQQFRTQLPLDDHRNFNITGSIDRVDRITDGNGQPLLRIIDYKTGSDKSEVKGIDELFESTNNSGHNKAVLQLFLYSAAYAHDKGYHGAIQPMLYLFRQFARQAPEPVTIEKVPLLDYREYADEVMGRLRAELVNLFNPDIPFRPNPSKVHCNYCDFKALCGLASE